MKLIIVDKRIPTAALNNLSKLGELLLLETSNITYPAISGHPDIFITKLDESLIVAPNTPNYITNQFLKMQIPFNFGTKAVGSEYPDTASYNVVADDQIVLHNFQFTDDTVIQNVKHLKMLTVKQGYSRCNCISLDGRGYICSDKGIEKALRSAEKNVLFVRPDEILLPGYANGFFGGCTGVFDETLFLIGSLKFHSQGDEVELFVESLGFHIYELYDGPFFDGGGVFIVDISSQIKT